MKKTVNDHYKKLLGQYVKEHREKKGYTQLQLAELLGVTPKSISYIERGENYPSPDNLFDLAHILDMSLDEFAFGRKTFDRLVSIEQINQTLDQLSAENKGILIDIVNAVSSTMLLSQSKSKR